MAMTRSLRENILQLDQNVPRYTSYPTAPHFQELSDTALCGRWLDELTPEQSFSLYIHVPFCKKMCWYCGCHTKITQRYAPVEDYLHLMMRESQILSNHFGFRPQLSHMHFGGGSPGILMAEDFARFMDRVRQGFDFTPRAEIAIEIDPRNVTEEKVEAYAKTGVNRVSLGVQDFNQTAMIAVNREQPFEVSQRAVELFRKHGIDQINMDLMYGLPHQTVETTRRTMEQVVSLDPARLSFFGYAHVPWMKKHMRLINEESLPDKELRFDLFEAGAQVLQESGYEAIGIDHFARGDDPLTLAAKNGTLRRNFQGYTTDVADVLLGLGASSIGRLPQGYIQNHPDMPLYKEAVLNGALPVKKYAPFSVDDRIRAEIIERLMCAFQVDIQAVLNSYDLPVDYFAEELWFLKRYQDLGFIRCSGNIIEINREARPAARLICSVFDDYFKAGGTAKHARAV